MTGQQSQEVDQGGADAGAADAHRLGHQPALDGLRGAAVAAVLLFHGGHLTGGYLGVDAFFVLSGFLITSLLLAEIASTNRVSLRTFWARRARRLLPALACVLAAVAIYAAFFAPGNELATIRGDALATMAYVANWRQILTSNDYFALFRSPSPLQHTWSLAIEEQFYLLWPLVIVAVTRGHRGADAVRRIFVTACIGAAASFLLMQLLFKASDTSRVYYGTDTRMSSILIGAALAAWLVMRGPVAAAKRRTLEGAAIVAIVVLGLAWSHLSGTSTWLYRGGFLVCAIAVVLVIAAGIHPDRGPVFRVLSWRPLRELGLISYGVYLWHWPIFVFLDADRAHITGWPLLILRILITLVVSVASFRFIERPIRYGALPKRVLAWLTPLVAVVLVVAIVTSTAGAVSASTAATTSNGGVLVVGDSVANSLFPGLVRAGIPAEEAWQPGCRLLSGKLNFTGTYSHNCPWRPEWRQAVRQQHPQVVLMVIGTWDLFDLEIPGTNQFVAPGSAAWDTYYAQQLNDAISLLTSTGARLVIPTLPCVASEPGVPHFDSRSAVNVGRVDAANAVLKQVVARHRDKVESPDLFGLLCPTGKYQQGVPGVDSVRDDGVHYSAQGAALVTSFLAPDLRHPTSDAPKKLVLIYGDSPITEARDALYDALPPTTGLQLENSTGPLLAMCDIVTALKKDLKNTHPTLIVLETQGGDVSPCMQTATGQPLAHGSPAFYAKFTRDAMSFFSLTRAAGVPVLVFAPPPGQSPAAVEQQTRLAAILHSVEQSFPDSSSSDLGRDALGGATWTKTLPCLADERTNTECRSGRIVVRGPDDEHLCPTAYARPVDVTLGCSVYSSGAVRYGRALAIAILAVTKDSGKVPSSVAPPSTGAPASG